MKTKKTSLQEAVQAKTVKKRITIRTTTPLLGAVAKDEAVWTKHVVEKNKEKYPEANIDPEAEAGTIPEPEQDVSGWTGFHTDEKTGELFIYEYVIKGFLKHAGNLMKDVAGVAALKSKLNNFVFVSPRRIGLGKTEPDGVLERPLRAQTAKGPRIALAKSDMLNEGIELSFVLTILPHKEIAPALVLDLFNYGEFAGLGQFRNGGYGRFEVVSIEDA